MFGVDLRQLCEQEGKKFVLPSIIEDCINYLSIPESLHAPCFSLRCLCLHLHLCSLLMLGNNVHFIFHTIGLDIKKEGLFRISGERMLVEYLREQYDQGQVIPLQGFTQPHVIATLLKQYFRELPTPLLTFDLFDCFLAVHSKLFPPSF